MLINNNHLKNIYFLLAKEYIDKKTIIYDKCIVALSEDESELVMYLKTTDLSTYDYLLVFHITEDELIYINTLPSVKNKEVISLDINNNRHVAVSYIEEDKRSITIIDTTDESIRIYNSNIQEIKNYNNKDVLFNNKTNCLLFSKSSETEEFNEFIVYVLKDSKYVLVNDVSSKFFERVYGCIKYSDYTHLLAEANNVINDSYCVKFHSETYCQLMLEDK